MPRCGVDPERVQSGQHKQAPRHRLADPLPRQGRDRDPRRPPHPARLARVHRQWCRGAAVAGRALAARENLDDAEIVHLMTLGAAPYVEPGLEERFRHIAFFIGSNVREAVPRAGPTSCPSSCPRSRSSSGPAHRRRRGAHPGLRPDQHGFCASASRWTSSRRPPRAPGSSSPRSTRSMPRTLGDSFLHVGDIDAPGARRRPAPRAARREPLDEVAAQIGRHVADLIPDGATLQMGIGAIPDAVLARARRASTTSASTPRCSPTA